MKTLVICGRSMGDLVFSTPVIRALKVQLDDAEVHGLVSLPSAFLLKENPYLDKVHVYTQSLWDTWRMLRKEKFDTVINLRTGWRAKLLSFLLGAKTYSIKSVYWKQWLMINLKINRLPNEHLTDRMLRVLQPLGIKPDDLGLDYFIPEKDKVALEWLPEAYQRGYVAFLINTPYTTRRLPVDRMIELCDRINRPIILLGTQDDAPTGELMNGFFDKTLTVSYGEGVVEVNQRTSVYNGCGKFNVNQMASVVRQARLVFTFDNDFIPVASAFKKEVYGLWGSTVLLFGRYPYRTKFTALENNRVSCRPCSSGGYDHCPKGHFHCMRHIRFDFYLP